VRFQHPQNSSEAARRNRPWDKNTGPKTAAGKAIVAQNSRSRMTGDLSVRQGRALIARIDAAIREARRVRQRALAAIGVVDSV
jgi:hypothetical protein